MRAHRQLMSRVSRRLYTCGFRSACIQSAAPTPLDWVFVRQRRRDELPSFVAQAHSRAMIYPWTMDAIQIANRSQNQRELQITTCKPFIMLSFSVFPTTESGYFEAQYIGYVRASVRPIIRRNTPFICRRYKFYFLVGVYGWELESNIIIFRPVNFINEVRIASVISQGTRRQVYIHATQHNRKR